MIAALRARWTREGPGIPADLPPKTGLALLGTTILREAWELFVLNLLIALCCVPLVTIPAAHAAGARVATRMLDDEPIYLWRDYWRAFAALFLPATLLGGAVLAVLGLGAYAVFIYGQAVLASPLFVVPLVIAGAALVFVAMAALNGLALLGGDDPRAGLIRRACMAALARPLPALAGLAAIAALWLAHVLFYPVSVFMPAVANFSLGVLFAVFAARPRSKDAGGARQAPTRADPETA